MNISAESESAKSELLGLMRGRGAAPLVNRLPVSEDGKKDRPADERDCCPHFPGKGAATNCPNDSWQIRVIREIGGGFLDHY